MVDIGAFRWAVVSLPVFIQVLIFFASLQNYYCIPSAFITAKAWDDYNNLVGYINNLDGDIYISSIGQLPSGNHLKYTASWIHLDDLVRSPGKQTSNDPYIRSVLADIIEPKGTLFIITEVPLEQDPLLFFSNDYHVLMNDFGDKYKSLREVPDRYQRRWLRYVYVHK